MRHGERICGLRVEWVQGVRAVPFIGRRGPPWRAGHAEAAAERSGRAGTQPESWLRTGEGMTPTGGPHLSVAGRKGKGRRAGLGWETGIGLAGFSWAAGRKGKGEKERWAGWAEKRKGVKERLFHF